MRNKSVLEHTVTFEQNMATKKQTDPTKYPYIPYLLSGASVVVSCYALYKSTHSDQNNTNSSQQNTVKQTTSHRYSTRSSSVDSSISSYDQDINGTATLSRIMQPDDANAAGNVHGGTTLKMIGHVGWLSATQYLNRNIIESESKQDTNDYYRGVLVRMEEMNFKLPIFIGEICICDAKVTFTSNHSFEVQVTVTAENAMSGEKRVTNSARLWFVGLRMPKIATFGHQIRKQDLVSIPPLVQKSADYERGKQRYTNQKRSRNNDVQMNILNAVDLHEWTDRLLCKNDFDKVRNGSTVCRLAQMTVPSDCFGTNTKTVDGGYVMKLMDSVAGCVGHSWTHARVVTVHINAINFHAPITAGDVCHCYGRLVFTSKRSMEVFVVSFIHDDDDEDDEDDKNIYKTLGHERLKLVSSALFTYVSLNRENPPKTIDVPMFTPHTSFETMVHKEAKQRYLERRKARQNKTTCDKYKPTVVVGPSGVGKGTLLQILKDEYPDRFAVAVSHTTRKPRDGEIDGVHYNFVDKERFENEIQEDQFIEYARIYGNIYGTSKQAVKDVIEQKKICLLEIDYVGAKLIKESAIDANYLFVTVEGEHEACLQRLERRGSETDLQIAKRVETSQIEFDFFKNNREFFDASISNDDLTQSGKEIIQLFKKWYEWL
eukprot:918421_1